MKKDSVQPNSLQIWIHAARPKTLPAALAPILVASALAWQAGGFQALPALYCLGFALFSQIAANFINDYQDFKTGVDKEDRLGPTRAVAAGWVRPSQMLWASILTLAVAVACGSMLIPYGGKEMWWVGGICVLFCCLYSPLSKYGLGDLFVLVFFGIIPVVFTYYVQVGMFSTASFLLGGIIGILSINILIANNYRDYYTDKNSGKRTSIVLLGLEFGERFYLLTGIVACVLNILLFYILGNIGAGLFVFLFLPLHIQAWHTMRRIKRGKELNVLLGLSSRNLLLFCVLQMLGMCFS